MKEKKVAVRKIEKGGSCGFDSKNGGRVCMKALGQAEEGILEREMKKTVRYAYK